MTEEEAKTKWCPMVQVSTSTENTVYTNRERSSEFACIASDCMWWVSYGSDIKIAVEEGKQYAHPLPATGYCGGAR